MVNTKPAAVAVHRQVVEIIDIPLVTQTVSTNRKIQLSGVSSQTSWDLRGGSAVMEPTPLRDGRRRSVGIQHHKESSDLGRVLR